MLIDFVKIPPSLCAINKLNYVLDYRQGYFFHTTLQYNVTEMKKSEKTIFDIY